MKNTPNAQIAEDLRNKIRNSENIEQLTGLTLERYKQWMDFTKEFYIPKNYNRQIDTEHQYPLSRYDLSAEENVKFCNNWKHLRYMTHEENKKKLNNMPTPLDRFKQAVIVIMYQNFISLKNE